MHGRSASATAWLGLTPEPERSLPELLAFLHGRSSGQRREQSRVTDWSCGAPAGAGCATSTGPPSSRWTIADGSRDGDAELALAVAQVVLEHDRMLIGLPGSAYYRTAERRRRLAEAIPVLEARNQHPQPPGDVMKLVLDTTACQGYGLCQEAAPDLVDLDDSGYADLIGDGTVPAAEHDHAHDAVTSCPARALRVQK